MKPNPCPVCGGTDLNLIDGFFYCVECGTQDTNAQETVVEHTMLGDGTFAHAATRKITKVLKDAIEMSGEWHKWHAFNFILEGLVEELVNLGASTGFRDKTLWIWTRYMKEFMDKKQMGTKNEIKEKEGRVMHKSLFQYEDEIEECSTEQNEKEEILGERKKARNDKQKKKQDQNRNSVKVVTKGLLISILYIALNLDRSDIQLSHLFRFIREGRLSIANCKNIVPSELDFKSIPHWKNFMNCNKEYPAISIRQTALCLIKVLDLGKPIVPDLRKIVNNYVTELCLPNDFKNLVFSLMHRVPCDFLDVGYNFAKKYHVRMPDYEGVVMGYVLVALKMMFGLDDQYEVLLSDTIDKINDEDNRLKSYKLGMYSEPTGRLFSFREWANYLQFRKTMLCKHYLPMAQQHNLDVDDCVFMEHLGERRKRKVLLGDEVTMDILNRIASSEEGNVIPKSEFVATLTPMANYTEVILLYIQDPEVKLLISEDFTQYSLKYACENLNLQNENENLIIGVSDENKTFNKLIVGNLVSKEYDFSMVFVRNCKNPNWLKTNPPTIDHVTKVEEIFNDKNSDHGYDSNLESTLLDGDDVKTDHEPKKLENIEEEKEDIAIFDDLFDDIDIKEEKDVAPDTECTRFQFENVHVNNEAIENHLGRSINEESVMREAEFNPETFQREQAIKELVLAACKKYKIPKPKEYQVPRGPTKRKTELVLDETGTLVPKKRKIEKKIKRGEAQKEMNKILTAYYANVEKELVDEVSEHVQSAIKDFIDLENTNEDQNGSNDSSLTNNDNNTIGLDDTCKSVDSSVMEVEGDAGEADLVKVDSKFDEKIYDVKQLYVKYSQKLNFESLLNNDDSAIDQLLERKIEEFRLSEPFTLCAKDLKRKQENEDNINNTDDEQKEAEEEKMFLEARLLQKSEKLEPLAQDPDKIKEFKYWLRHYTSLCMRKNVDLKDKFDLELKEKFPKSFGFIMMECAALLDCTAFSLYKHVQNLERTLFT